MHTAWDTFKKLWAKEEFRKAWEEDERIDKDDMDVNEFKLESNDNITRLYRNDSLLIQFESNDNKEFRASFFCDEPTYRELFLDCEGERKIWVRCETEDDLNRCSCSFIELSTNGFTSERSTLVGMDWGDIVSVTEGRGVGKYYYEISDADNVSNAVDKIKAKIDNDYASKYNLIFLFHGNTGMYDFTNLALKLEDGLCDEILIQYMYREVDEDNPIQVDVWAFPQNEGA